AVFGVDDIGMRARRREHGGVEALRLRRRLVSRLEHELRQISRTHRLSDLLKNLADVILEAFLSRRPASAPASSFPPSLSGDRRRSPALPRPTSGGPRCLSRELHDPENVFSKPLVVRDRVLDVPQRGVERGRVNKGSSSEHIVHRLLSKKALNLKSMRHESPALRSSSCRTFFSSFTENQEILHGFFELT